MRTAQDTTPQRQLAYQLALSIDKVIAAAAAGSGAGAAAGELEELIDANPRSAFSTHVLHNIGVRRANWLLAYREQLVARGGPLATSPGPTRS